MNDAVQIQQAGGTAQAAPLLPGLMVFTAGGPVTASGDPALLLETGDYLLLETGDHLLLE